MGCLGCLGVMLARNQRSATMNPPGVAGYAAGIRGPSPGAEVEARACRSAGDAEAGEACGCRAAALAGGGTYARGDLGRPKLIIIVMIVPLMPRLVRPGGLRSAP